MKKIALLAAMFALFACTSQTPVTPVTPEPDPDPVTPVTPEPEPDPETPSFAKGADISWVTEMESKGYKFYDASGTEKECTALMKELGVNAMRYRVWVNPAEGWCNKADVLVKAKRAQELGLDIMIDFHYSDSWADPAKQNTPAAWKDKSLVEMSAAVNTHTTEVLRALKDAGVDVKWVQVGNETNTGMCWPTGKLSNTSTQGFSTLANAGYDAVKSVYPEALVIIHHSNAQELEKNRWFYGLISGSVRFDMIGLSLYPSYWDSKINAYPDWNAYCSSALSTFRELNREFAKPVMLVEFGMPVSEPDKAKAALQYILNGVKDYEWFKGVFYWEPESEHSRNGYDYGAFANGRSTGVLDLFKQ